MPRAVLALLVASVGVLAGCDRDYDEERTRTVRVEVVSVPSGLLVDVSVAGDARFQASTPINRDVITTVWCDPVGFAIRCHIYGRARVTGVDPAGKRVTMCLSDGGERECKTGDNGAVSLELTFFVFD
jgi:hypothetical protein